MLRTSLKAIDCPFYVLFHWTYIFGVVFFFFSWNTRCHQETSSMSPTHGTTNGEYFFFSMRMNRLLFFALCTIQDFWNTGISITWQDFLCFIHVHIYLIKWILWRHSLELKHRSECFVFFKSLQNCNWNRPDLLIQGIICTNKEWFIHNIKHSSSYLSFVCINLHYDRCIMIWTVFNCCIIVFPGTNDLLFSSNFLFLTTIHQFR